MGRASHTDVSAADQGRPDTAPTIRSFGAVHVYLLEAKPVSHRIHPKGKASKIASPYFLKRRNEVLLLFSLMSRDLGTSGSIPCIVMLGKVLQDFQTYEILKSYQKGKLGVRMSLMCRCLKTCQSIFFSLPIAFFPS